MESACANAYNQRSNLEHHTRAIINRYPFHPHAQCATVRYNPQVHVLFQARVVEELHIAPPMLRVHVHNTPSCHGTYIQPLIDACCIRAKTLLCAVEGC